MECRDRSENLINRNMTNFCIEAIAFFFSTPRKYIFFDDRKKNPEKNGKNCEKIKKIHTGKYFFTPEVKKITQVVLQNL